MRGLSIALAAAIVGCAAASGPEPQLARRDTSPYGKACQPLQRDSSGAIVANPCGAYLCIDGACSSCTSDAECQRELGSPECMEVAGWLGKSCGRPMPKETAPAAPPQGETQPPASP